jgi:hypothetical protein
VGVACSGHARSNCCRSACLHPCTAQIDFLEHPSITDVVVCSVVLEEVKHKNTSAYQRLRALTSPTHAHKRFYVFANEHHRSGTSVLLVAGSARG